MQFNLFDQVRLLEPIELTESMNNAINPLAIAPVGTIGNIVEVLEPGEAFLVEMFGDWIVSESNGDLRRASGEEKNAFRETIGVETVYSQQIELIHRSTIVKDSLLRLIDELPESSLLEVQEFAEAVKEKIST